MPVNDATNRGQGYLEYAVRVKQALPTGTEIRGVAKIVFDTNAAIATNQANPHDPSQGTDPDKEALVTLDAGPPTSEVATLPAKVPPTFEVGWSGSDEVGGPPGSGIAFFDIFVSDDGGPYVLWQVQTAATSAEFTGVDGHTYRFYSVAVDQVGHSEPPATSFDTEVKVVAFPWRNTRNARDVNDDGFVVPQDALIVINELNNPTTHDDVGKLPSIRPDTARFYYDVTGDGFCVPGDVLSIINFLNGGSGGEGEPLTDGSGEPNWQFPLVAAIQPASDFAGRYARPDRSHTVSPGRSPLLYVPESPITDTPSNRQWLEDERVAWKEPDDFVEISDELALDILAATRSGK